MPLLEALKNGNVDIFNIPDFLFLCPSCEDDIIPKADGGLQKQKRQLMDAAGGVKTCKRPICCLDYYSTREQQRKSHTVCQSCEQQNVNSKTCEQQNM